MFDISFTEMGTRGVPEIETSKIKGVLEIETSRIVITEIKITIKIDQEDHAQDQKERPCSLADLRPIIFFYYFIGFLIDRRCNLSFYIQYSIKRKGEVSLSRKEIGRFKKIILKS